MTNERHSAGFCQTQSLSFPAKIGYSILFYGRKKAKGEVPYHMSVTRIISSTHYTNKPKADGALIFPPSLPLSISALFYG